MLCNDLINKINYFWLASTKMEKKWNIIIACFNRSTLARPLSFQSSTCSSTNRGILFYGKSAFGSETGCDEREKIGTGKGQSKAILTVVPTVFYFTSSPQSTNTQTCTKMPSWISVYKELLVNININIKLIKHCLLSKIP